jgi:hypothetical protein
MPSAGKLCKFEEITHLQEKIILKSIAQQSGAYASFMYAMSKIMEENTLEQHQFNIIDRLFYSIYTKAYCFGNDLDYILKCTGCNKSIKYSINLEVIVNAIKYLSENFTNIIDHNSWRFNICPPDINRDILLREIKESEIYDYETIDMLENLIYVRSIYFMDNEIDFTELTLPQHLDIFNNMYHEDGVALIDHITEFRKKLYSFNDEQSLLDLKCVCGSNLLYFGLDSYSFDAFLSMIYNGDLNILYQKELNYRTLFPGSDIDSLAPVERDLLISLKSNANQQSESDTNSDGEIDLAGV